MKRWIFAAVAALTFATASLAAEPNTYQVTGPVLDVSADKITVQKGKEKWELARTADTKGGADVKVGDKVTIKYTMTAKSIEVSAGKAAKGGKKK